MLRLLLVGLLLFNVAFAKHELYDGFAVFEITVQNEVQAQQLYKLQDDLNLDVWSHALPSRPGTVLVSKDNKNDFADKLFNAGISYVIAVDNVKEQLDLEDSILQEASSKQANVSRIGLSFDTIHRYDVVDRYLVDLAAAYPDVVTVVSGGRSIEGRDIKYIRISTTNFQDQSKPVVFLQSLLHAREWATLPASLYAIQRLVLDVTEPDLINNIDWIILPIANPDGYEHAHTSSRFWRKNRRPATLCPGIDLNRNFDIYWGTASSSSACSETFHGSGPFSEPEAAIIGSIMREHSSRLAMFVDIHSFGSYILYGYGNAQLPPNALLIHLAGVQMAEAIDAVKWPSNRNYIVGNTVAVLYEASGSAGDYGQYTGLPFAISYTYELPAYENDAGLNGFLVHPDFIEQAGYETWEGLKTGARFALEQWRGNRNENKFILFV